VVAPEKQFLGASVPKVPTVSEVEEFEWTTPIAMAKKLK